jgi:polyisoprenoid-binding protein YceI
MKKTIYPMLIAIVIGISAFTIINSLNWKVKEDSYSIKFSGKKVEGVFKGLKANIVFDEVNPSNSKISATIDAASSNTGNGMKNKHVGQGLEADKYLTIKFESTSVIKKGSSYEAIGKLTIKDVTKEITLPFTFENKGGEGVFSGKFSVVPKDYNVTKMGTPDLVEIQLTIPVTK